MQTDQTYGQKIVRVQFNPSSLSDVDTVKQDFARLIDNVNQREHEGNDPAEFDRIKNSAICYLEAACMYAVKMLTTGK